MCIFPHCSEGGLDLDKLIKRTVDGDKAAFEVIYKKTKDAVYYTALSVLRDRGLSEDVMQTTYLKVLKNARAYTPNTNVVAWIIRIARNEALNVKKSRGRESTVDSDEQEYMFGTSAPDEYGVLIDIARRTLPDDEFQILMLAAVSGYKRREIAKMLEMPIATVTWKYNKATQKMRQALNDGKGGAI